VSGAKAQTQTGREAERTLEVKDLSIVFHTYAGDVKALEGVELDVLKSEILGLVGESGCGKSVTALAIAGLLPANAEVTAGEVRLSKTDLLHLDREQMRLTRLRDIAMVFQDPTTYLNPVFTIGSQILEVLTSDLKLRKNELIEERLKEIEKLRASGGALPPDLEALEEHLKEVRSTGRISKGELRRLAKQMTMNYLHLVKLPEPNRVFKMYPFELSGGMRQRAMIAMALVRRPQLLLADEITTALDVTVQAQILKLIKELRDTIDTSILLITHDLGVVAEVCDRVAVMYAGDVIEVAPVKELFKNPLHPYTQGLLAAVPRPDKAASTFHSISGSVPDLIYPPSGCRFHPRCPKAFDKCPLKRPTLVEMSPGHFVACFLYGER
jgi:peptide/nickel transport system ATP-binding protein